MTVVNPKSISGINSITMASGSDNLLTIHANDTSEKVRVNSSGDVIVGSGVTLSPDGDIFATGVTTATTFVGALTGNVTGNATGLSGTPNISAGTIAGSTGTFTGNVDIAGNLAVDSGSNGMIDFGDITTAYGRLYADDSNGVLIGSKSNHNLILRTNNTEKVRIDTSGRLLIGTTTEGEGTSDNLTIADSSNCGMTIRSGTSNEGNIFFSDGTSGADEYRGTIQYNHGSDFLTLGTDGSERFRIGSSGQFGIGGATYGSSGQVLTSGGASAAPTWAAASGGKVLQVISSVKRDTASNSTGNGSTWEYDDSSLRVQITAANASNTFLILASVTTSCSASVHTGLRDSSNNTTLMATGASSRRAATSGHDHADSHSASTVPIIGTITAGDTSQHSFYFQFSHTSGSNQTIYLNRGTNDGDAYDRARYVSSIVVMEIEA